MNELKEHQSVKALLEEKPLTVEEMVDALNRTLEEMRGQIAVRRQKLEETTKVFEDLKKKAEELAMQDAELNELEKKALQLLIQRLEKL